MTGYLVPEDDFSPMDGYMSDEDLDEDLQEEEETPPKLVKKRKLENGDSPKADKKPLGKLLADTKKVTAKVKQADAMKKILENKEESEGDSSDDDSDDDDMDDSEVIFSKIPLPLCN